MAIPMGLLGNTFIYSALIHSFNVFSIGIASSCRNCSKTSSVSASSFILLSMSYHSQVLQQICVLREPYNASSLCPAFSQNRHILHIHRSVNSLYNFLVYHWDLHAPVLLCNQTTQFFVRCYDIPNNNPGAFCLFYFHPAL